MDSLFRMEHYMKILECLEYSRHTVYWVKTIAKMKYISELLTYVICLSRNSRKILKINNYQIPIENRI